MTKNALALKTLTEKYGKICMSGGITTSLNILTFHHCFVLNRNGGRADEFNGASATRLSHSGIHIISEDNYKWDKAIKDYIREYKSYLQPKMSVEEFVALRVIQEMREACNRDIEYRVLEMGYETFITKDKQLCYKRTRR